VAAGNGGNLVDLTSQTMFVFSIVLHVPNHLAIAVIMAARLSFFRCLFPVWKTRKSDFSAHCLAAGGRNKTKN
jgi:hypothetical protein